MQERILYAKAKTGKILQWSVQVMEDETGVATIIRRSSQVGGKQSENHKIVHTGANIGKKNEQTPYQNACVKANRYWLDKVEDNWQTDINDAGKITFVKPMLAETYKANKVKFPTYVQTKLNGARCVQFRHLGDERMLSRECNEFDSINHIKSRIEHNFGNYSPDGELYIHGESFEHIISLVKKYKAGESETLQYWVYDLAIPDKTFEERIDILEIIFDKMSDEDRKIFIEVPTKICNSVEHLKQVHDKYVAQGYEGLIIRNPNGEYGFNDRNWDLIKYKEFIDAEFEITGYKAEVWHDELNDCYRNLIVFECITEEGKTFDVRPNGSFLKREEMYKNGDSFISKMLTVRYQNLSEDDGIPIFPIGILTEAHVRDYE